MVSPSVVLWTISSYIYLPLTCCSRPSLQPLFDCFQDIRDWMSQNFLIPKELKTEVFSGTHESTSTLSLSRSHLQYVQNATAAAVRWLTGSCKPAHKSSPPSAGFTSALESGLKSNHLFLRDFMDWLPLTYLTVEFLTTPWRTLRSSDQSFLVVSQTQWKLGVTAASRDPSLWKELPPRIRSVRWIESFKAQLRAHLTHSDIS